MEIVPARKEHVSSILEIWKEFMDFHGDIDPFLKRTPDGHIHFANYLEETMNSSDGLVLAALVEGDLAGYSLSRINRYPPVFRIVRYGYICDMAVKSGFRRKGIGEKMLEKILEWFDARGLERAELRVIAGNNIGRGFWEKMGFKTYSHMMYQDREIAVAKPVPNSKPAPPGAEGCPFCDRVKGGDVLLKNDLAFAITDEFPVSEGHTLILPIRHVADYFELTGSERAAMEELLRYQRRSLLERDPSIAGFNVGVNCGLTAGQTIFHCHVHLIPRRPGDTPNPRGGVRGVIPPKMHY